MKTNRKHGFTIVELVVVIAIIAVLAAVLIPTFTSIVKKANDSAYLQERTNQQIADLAEKVEKINYFTWEDFEKKLAEELAKINDDTVTKDDVKAAVDAAWKEYAAYSQASMTGLTADQVKKIVDEAMAGQLTTAQVEAIVKAAVGSKNVDVNAIANQVIAKLPKTTGITKEEMQKAINEALSSLNISSINEEDIANALAAFGVSTLTKEDINGIISSATSDNTTLAKALNIRLANLGIGKQKTVYDMVVKIGGESVITGTNTTSTVSDSSSTLLYDLENNKFFTVKDGVVDYDGELSLSGALDEAYKYWTFSKGKSETYSTYLLRGSTLTSETVSTGIDVGYKTDVTSITYDRSTATSAQTVVIRTNGGTLTVNAPLDTVMHYGNADSVNIVAVASASYHENGTVPFIQISKGRIEIEATGDVNGIHVANVQTVDTNGNITKTENTFSNDVVLTLNGKDVKLTRDTIGTEIATPVLVCEVQANANSDEYIWLVGDGTIENAKVYVTETNAAPDTSVASTTTTENASAAAIAIANNATNTGTEEAPAYVAVDAGTSAESAQVVSALKGTGTQADPFLIYDYETMQYVTTISSVYINDYDIVNYYYNLKIDGNYVCDTWQDAIDMAKENGYSLSHLNDSPFYFKVKDGTKIIDCNEDNQLWVSVKLYGNFDGNGVTFTNLDSPLFSKVYSQSSTIGNFTADCNIVSQTGRAAICTNSAFNTLFHDITVTGYIEGQGQTSAGVSYPGSGVTEFKNFNVSADIVSLGDSGAAVFVLNPYKLLSSYGGDSNSKLVFDNCHFSGKISATGDCRFFYAHTISVPVEIKNIDSSEYGSVVNNYNHFALASQSSKITKNTIDISEVVAGDIFVFDKLDASAVTCTVTIGISPNGTDETGSFTGVYLKDSNIELGDDGKFHTTNAVKITSASVNDNNKVAGLNDLDSNGKFEHYNIISSGYGTTHNGGFVTVIQYDSRGNVVAYASATLFSKNN